MRWAYRMNLLGTPAASRDMQILFVPTIPPPLPASKDYCALEQPIYTELRLLIVQKWIGSKRADKST